MTPTEKAISLLYQYKNLELDFSRHQYESRFLYMEEPDAIECAKIVVENIIKAIDWHDFETPNKQIEFWENVKQELEKL